MEIEFKNYSFNDGKKIPLDDINLPQEVKDYVTNLYNVNEVIFEIYPPELLKNDIIISTWNDFDLNDDNVEFQSFNLYQKSQFDVFSQGVTFYGKIDDKPGYMVYRYTVENIVIIIKI